MRRWPSRWPARANDVEEIAPSHLPDWPSLPAQLRDLLGRAFARSWEVTKRCGPGEDLREALSPMVRAFWDASARYGKGDVMRYQAANVSHTLAFADPAGAA